MIDLIIDRFGTDAVADIAAAYRDGAGDAEALEAGTGMEADELYADFYSAFGADEPQPVTPEEILPSDVDRPPAASDGGGGGAPDDDDNPPAAPVEPDADDGVPAWLVVAVLVIAVGGALGVAIAVMRRSARQEGPT